VTRRAIDPVLLAGVAAWDRTDSPIRFGLSGPPPGPLDLRYPGHGVNVWRRVAAVSGRGGMGMLKALDGSFWAGGALVVVTLAVAAGAVLSPSFPIIGNGRLALVTVGILGMAACAVAGIGQAPAVGWTNPAVVVGSVLGVLALLVIAAGLGVWPGVVQPVGDALAKVSGGSALTTEQSSIAALAGIVVIKWIVGMGLAWSRVATA
jgi:hypothetical protein